MLVAPVMGTAGFNPCFLGTCPRTRPLSRKKSRLKSFNPCFLGTCPRTVYHHIMLYPNWSFNPCFLGTCPRTEKDYLDARQYACFNPCFLGTCPRTTIFQRYNVFKSRFNPCFLGTCPRTVLLACMRYNLIGFQSLFSWNLPSDPPAYYSVDILGKESSFNPCFLGTCPRTAPFFRPFPCFSVSNRPFLALPLA